MADKYIQLHELGRGAFGTAWLVKDKTTGQKHVSKIIQIKGLSSRDLDQCVTEVAVLSACHHMNIVRYNQAFVSEGCLHIIMEYAAGGDLAQKIRNQNGVAFPTDVILNWFLQVVLALEYIHSKNILHRDLKPQNIFLMANGVVKLGDFGIARVLCNSEDLASTRIGTPFYVSPEICERKPYNSSSDMWAAGCLLYEMCCLQVPFNATNLDELMNKIVRAHCTPLLPKKFGPVISQISSKLLLVDPSSRLTASEILQIPELSEKVKVIRKKNSEERSRSLSRNCVKVDARSRSGSGKRVPRGVGMETARSPLVNNEAAKLSQKRTGTYDGRSAQEAGNDRKMVRNSGAGDRVIEVPRASGRIRVVEEDGSSRKVLQQKPGGDREVLVNIPIASDREVYVPIAGGIREVEYESNAKLQQQQPGTNEKLVQKEQQSGRRIHIPRDGGLREVENESNAKLQQHPGTDRKLGQKDADRASPYPVTRHRSVQRSEREISGKQMSAAVRDDVVDSPKSTSIRVKASGVTDSKSKPMSEIEKENSVNTYGKDTDGITVITPIVTMRKKSPEVNVDDALKLNSPRERPGPPIEDNLVPVVGRSMQPAAYGKIFNGEQQATPNQSPDIKSRTYLVNNSALRKLSEASPKLAPTIWKQRFSASVSEALCGSPAGTGDRGDDSDSSEDEDANEVFSPACERCSRHVDSKTYTIKQKEAPASDCNNNNNNGGGRREENIISDVDTQKIMLRVLQKAKYDRERAKDYILLEISRHVGMENYGRGHAKYLAKKVQRLGIKQEQDYETLKKNLPAYVMPLLPLISMYMVL